jgi:PKD repeat protein
MRTPCRIAVLASLVVAGACTIKNTEAPPLAGPSEFALRIALQAVPDSILMDGASQAVITIEATGPDTRPVRGLAVRIETSDGVDVFDIGTLSARTAVTGDDGRTRVIYTSPRGTVGGVVTILVTPIGTDFQGEQPRSVQLRLVPPGPVPPPNQAAPTPVMTVTPASPRVLENALFDASQTTDGTTSGGAPILCGARCTYQWEFGDGATANGIFASHAYQALGNYLVRLTVTDDQGAAVQIAQTVAVQAGDPPTGGFTFSPTAPAVNEPVLFNAVAVQPAPGRRIVSYEWDFGNGRFGSGVTTSTTYGAVGTYQVTLAVTDDAGSRRVIGPTPITVSATGALDAALSVSPASGTTSTDFFFDASASRPGPSTIVEYRFTFGDNSPDVVGASPTTTHRYLVAGSYTVRVTVRDAAGRTDSQTVTVNVQ